LVGHLNVFKIIFPKTFFPNNKLGWKILIFEGILKYYRDLNYSIYIIYSTILYIYLWIFGKNLNIILIWFFYSLKLLFPILWFLRWDQNHFSWIFTEKIWGIFPSIIRLEKFKFLKVFSNIKIISQIYIPVLPFIYCTIIQLWHLWVFLFSLFVNRLFKKAEHYMNNFTLWNLIDLLSIFSV